MYEIQNILIGLSCRKIVKTLAKIPFDKKWTAMGE